MRDEIGSKAARLKEIKRIGIKIPEGFAIPQKAFMDSIVDNGIYDNIKTLCSDLPTDLQGLKERSENIQRLLGEIVIPKEIADEIIDACHRLRALSEKEIQFAVRSSGIMEDVPQASFAGLYSTFLRINSDEEVLNSIKGCWQSAFGFKVLVYLKRLCLKIERPEDIALGILIQQMINSRFSGVLFTINPVTGDASRLLIEYSTDIDKPVVSGESTPKAVLIDKITNQMENLSTINNPQSIKLEERYIYQLADIGKRIEQHFGCYQDIEWVIDKDASFPEDIIILQARPETVWNIRHQKPFYKKGQSILNLMQNKET